MNETLVWQQFGAMRFSCVASAAHFFIYRWKEVNDVKKTYEQIQVELLTVEAKDILTASNETPDEDNPFA